MGVWKGSGERVGRRTFLGAVGVSGAIGFAGCLSENGSEGGETADQAVENSAEALIRNGFEAAGIDPPFETTIYANAENDERIRWAQLVQYELNETDLFDVGFEQLEWGTYEQLLLNMAENEENCLVTLDLSGGWDPHIYVNSLFHSAHRAPNGFNFNHYADERTDELIDSAVAESDREQRVETYGALQERLAQQVPISIVRSGEEATVYRQERIDDWRQYPLPGSEYDPVYAPYGGEFLETEDETTELVGDAVATVSNTDPVRMNDTTSNMATSLIYEGLLAVDFDGTPRPLLATDWEQLDATTYRFDLREGVEFHNGETFTADHVRASFGRYEGSPREPDVYDWYDGVDVIDDTELEVHLTGEYGPFETSVGVPIVPLAAGDGEIDLADEPVGTGPYRFDEHAEGEYWRLRRFDDHWFDGDDAVPAQPTVETITMRIISRPAARRAALEADELDLSVGLSADDVADLDGDPEYGVERAATGSFDFLIYPQYLEPFDDVDVRRGIDRLLPRQTIVEEVYAGQGTVAYTPIPPLLSEFSIEGGDPGV
ncbi:ABC transporter substrate-binding protein [Natrarchaeobius chitinivorans]|uniref:ABC transporter substrate-binding protein n=1 Tax=Natrarchaeobius chitinivorans TaxID=1679083 RepID=A0A3N6M6Q0_NATCH|nr:ABC transporter substrate-binding protein [Natrarchaeobius chitinivorans]RQG97887.1 ABC transporter substrate-binding protein [Natrarchaeobius chitinivorans]